MIRTAIEFRPAYRLALLAGCTIAQLAIVWALHKQFWWPPDDGAYAYVADLLNQGFVLHKDIQDVHMGYINFLHAWALRLFGNDFVSLRYPLVLLTLLQSLLLALLFYRQSLITAIAVLIVCSSLTFVQFLNPSANWYALFLACLIIAVLHKTSADEKSNRHRLLWLGFLLGMVFCFRQLSAVFVSIGAFSYLAYEQQIKTKGNWREYLLGRATLAAMAILLILYLLKKTQSHYIFLVFGIWPVLLLLYQAGTATLSNKETLKIFSQLLLGSLLAGLPLLIYHGLHGSIRPWLHDTIFAAISMNSLTFFTNHQYTYNLMLLSSIGNLFSFNVQLSLNGFFWFALLTAPACLGALTLFTLAKTQRPIPAIVFIAVFFMLVSVHYQIPIYLFYSSALTLSALLCYASAQHKYWRYPAAIAVIGISAIGLIYQAAQPLERGFNGILSGHTAAHNTHCNLAHCDLYTTPGVAAQYQELLSIINEHTNKDDTVLAIPFNPEINYLSQRRSPFRFFNSGLDLNSPDKVNSAIETLQQNKPAMVILKQNDKYNTELISPLIKYIGQHYRLHSQLNEFTILIPGK